jgi:hypothetical protein
MPRPNFVIAGAAKCGTTSLFHYLKQHPRVGMLESKDANFFVDFRVKVHTLEAYEALFEGFSGLPAIGEAPVRSLYDESALLKIRQCLPGVRVILILRNPADMAYSLWGHMVRNGERLSFRRALKAEPRRMADPRFRERCNNWYGDYDYFHRGLYSDQVRRCFDLFGRESVLVLLFDDLKRAPVETCRECFRFLGVAPEFEPVIETHNPGKVYRHRGLHKLVSQPPAWLMSLEAGLMGERVRRWRESVMRWNTLRLAPFDPKLRDQLLARYQPDIRKLEALLDRDLSHWS